jgi:hypothetical protein
MWAGNYRTAGAKSPGVPVTSSGDNTVFETTFKRAGYLLPMAIVGALCAANPIGQYEIFSQIFSLFVPGVQPIAIDPLWKWFGCVAALSIPVLAVDSWRAARALDGEKEPFAITLAAASVVITPVWIAPMVAQFGPLAYLAALVWWPIGALTPVAFVVAAAQVDAELRGEKVREFGVNTLYEFGGFLGVALARRAFPESKAAQKFPSEFPTGLVFLVVGIVAFLAMNGPGVLSQPTWLR